jgi:hypothetical protein
VNSWKIILATIVIFCAGVITGGLLVDHVNHPRPGNHRQTPNPHPGLDSMAPQPLILKTNFADRLDEAVHLTPEQREKIDKIIADGQQENRDLWKLVAPQFRTVLQDVRLRIRDVLTPEQQKEYEKLMKNIIHQPPNGTNTPPVNLPQPASTNGPAS